MDYKRLWTNLYSRFIRTKKASWDKNEIVRLMTDMELEQARKKVRKGGKRG